MSTQRTYSGEPDPTPQYRTESIEDVEDILRRAAQFVDANTLAPAVVAELEQAADFVEANSEDWRGSQ